MRSDRPCSVRCLCVLRPCRYATTYHSLVQHSAVLIGKDCVSGTSFASLVQVTEHGSCMRVWRRIKWLNSFGAWCAQSEQGGRERSSDPGTVIHVVLRCLSVWRVFTVPLAMRAFDNPALGGVWQVAKRGGKSMKLGDYKRLECSMNMVSRQEQAHGGGTVSKPLQRC